MNVSLLKICNGMELNSLFLAHLNCSKYSLACKRKEPNQKKTGFCICGNKYADQLSSKLLTTQLIRKFVFSTWVV